MRFISYENLILFLRVFDRLGYQAPFLDYKNDMKKKGCEEHISRYVAKIIMNDDTIDILFVYYEKVVYTIKLRRN